MESTNKNGGKMAGFKWSSDKSRAAVLLAEGLTQKAVAAKIGQGLRTIERWSSDTEFSAEVDRLSVLTDIASKAERLRLAKRIVRQRVNDDLLETDKDLLDWLKFAQSETDGLKLNLADLMESYEI